MSTINVELAASLYARGLSLEEVAKRMQRSSPAGIRSALIREGVVMRRRGPRGGRPGWNREINIQDARNLRGQGWTYQRIGDKYGVTRQAVQQILARWTGKEVSS
jgi:predicted transcriptional regulator